MTSPHPLAAWTQLSQVPRQRRKNLNPAASLYDDEESYLALRRRARNRARAQQVRRDVTGT